MWSVAQKNNLHRLRYCFTVYDQQHKTWIITFWSTCFLLLPFWYSASTVGELQIVQQDVLSFITAAFVEVWKLRGERYNVCSRGRQKAGPCKRKKRTYRIIEWWHENGRRSRQRKRNFRGEYWVQYVEKISIYYQIHYKAIQYLCKDKQTNMFKRTEVAKLNSSKGEALNLAKFNANDNYLDNLSCLGMYELWYKLEVLSVFIEPDSSHCLAWDTGNVLLEQQSYSVQLRICFTCCSTNHYWSSWMLFAVLTTDH